MHPLSSLNWEWWGKWIWRQHISLRCWCCRDQHVPWGRWSRRGGSCWSGLGLNNVHTPWGRSTKGDGSEGTFQCVVFTKSKIPLYIIKLVSHARVPCGPSKRYSLFGCLTWLVVKHDKMCESVKFAVVSLSPFMLFHAFSFDIQAFWEYASMANWKFTT